ncbi:nuclear receptor coactivator 2 isoform X2 [Neocloeon triangulifer]|uniref:nuclear receptor coactivator 2 isoform X2 n=1 Tax=Neocloeon triangulifer TaxID=2078957 RepID=UPI00286F355C|nr:nuclear receptor coactivator 2 isoform X2 [Neocloeon triangulifer]
MSSSALAATTKKRKKSDGRQQQQQLNKCLNEKRRREQENIYIEELAELISASFADMSSLSVKPDKCAILQETVNQIRRIKQQEAQSGDAVQQGEVSSSKPALIGHQVFGPLLLEALEGFLFVVSSEGKVEFVTDTVSQFTRFTKDDVLGKSIYNFLHHGDHARFSSGLLPMTLGWPNEGAAGHSRSRTFTCRLLIKPPDDQDETMEEKQQRVSKYETMQISSMLIPFPGDRSGQSGGENETSESEGGPSMMCVARRMPANENMGNFCAQFTTKLDRNGIILSIDSSGIGLNTCPGLGKDLIGRSLHQIVISSDAPRLAAHLSEALTVGQSTSPVIRLAINMNGPPVPVQTKSKVFKASPASSSSSMEPDFIMATHTLMNMDMEGGPMASPASIAAPSSPLLTPTGASLAPSSLDSSPPSRHVPSQTLPTTFSGFSSDLGNLDFDFLTHTPSDWDLQPPATAASTASGGSGSNWGSPPPPKPSPQQTQTQQTTNWDRGSPSPRNHPWDNNSQPSTPCSPMAEDMEIPSGSRHSELSSTINKESARLRNLLTNRQQVPPNSSPGHKHRILKGLLNQDDDEDDLDASTESPMDSTNARIASNNSSAAASSTSNNNMLLKLLNEKSDDDDVEARAGLKKQNELLQQLLKDDESERSNSGANSQDDSLLKSLGFSNSSPPTANSSQVGECSSVVSGGRKRPSLESDDGVGGKRLQQAPMPAQQMGIASGTVIAAPSQVSSSGNSSRLWERNKMLASLLAKQPSQPTTIPPIPTSLIQATPNERLPKVVDSNVANPNRGSGVGRGPPQSPASQQVPPKVSPGSTPVVAPQPPQGPTQPNLTMPLEGTAGPSGRMEAADSSGVMLNSSTGELSSWESSSANAANDEMLSDILDQVIDIVPENMSSDAGALSNYMDPIDGSMMMAGGLGNSGGMMGGSGGMAGASSGSSSSANGNLSEKLAISAIQKSLMQFCEKAVKSPPQYQTPMQPPPVYPTPAQQRAALGFSQPQPVQAQPIMQNAAAAAARAQFAAQATLVQANQVGNQATLQQRRKLLNSQQQMQKQRLLLQQQQTQVLINNAAQVKQDPHSNMDALIRNNTMPPNVTLQRSASVPDSQLSPGYDPLSPSQQRPQQQQQQPHFNAFNAGFGNQQTRLSPLPRSVSSNALPSFQQQQQQQLSPRVSQGMPQQQWAGQDNVGNVAANRLTMQQQQNPMLNAQLTGAYPQQSTPRIAPNAYNQQVQRPALHAAAGGGARSSPFTPENAPPSSPGTAGTSSPGLFQAGAAGNIFPTGSQNNFNPQLQMQMQMQQQQHQMRLQRAMSHPAGASNGPPQQQQMQQQQNIAGANNGMPSEFVLQKLRATVSAGNQQHQQQPMQSGAMVSSPRPQPPQQQMVQLGANNLISNEELQALGINFEIDNGNKMWDSPAQNPGQQQQQHMGPGPSSVREDAGMRGGGTANQSSLLQKLLSE